MKWVGLIVLVIVIGVIVLAIQNWYITLALGAIGGAIGLVIYLINDPNDLNKLELKKLRRESEAARKATLQVILKAREIVGPPRYTAEELDRLQRHRDEQQGYRKQMVVLGGQSIGLFEFMPEHLSSAEKYLDQAAVDFADGAFAPFWDSIEKAANTLGRFDEGVRHIKDNSSHYIELIKKYEDTPPEFPLARQSIAKLDVGTGTAERMKAIVRNAQRNFQFATIYEQRKTNQILVAGFTNLAQALDQMAWRITASIDDLTSSVDVMTSTLDGSMRAIHSRMGDIAETTIQHHEELMKGTSEGAARERKALEMLDNIQRGRRPSL